MPDTRIPESLRAPITVPELISLFESMKSLRFACEKLVELHWNWEPGGRATRKFCDSNYIAIETAKAAIEISKSAILEKISRP